MAFENIRKNALTRQLKGSLGRLVKKATGMSPFRKTKQGGDKINTNALRKFKKTKEYQRLSTKTKRRITLAINFEMFKRDKKSGGRKKSRSKVKRSRSKKRRSGR